MSVGSWKRATYNPKQPLFHLLYWNEISRIKHKVRDEESAQAKRGVIRREEQTQRPEQTLYRQEGHVIEKVESPERTPGTMEICHEINNDIVDQNANRRKWQI